MSKCIDVDSGSKNDKLSHWTYLYLIVSYTQVMISTRFGDQAARAYSSAYEVLNITYAQQLHMPSNFNLGLGFRGSLFRVAGFSESDTRSSGSARHNGWTGFTRHPGYKVRVIWFSLYTFTELCWSNPFAGFIKHYIDSYLIYAYIIDKCLHITFVSVLLFLCVFFYIEYPMDIMIAIYLCIQTRVSYNL